METNDKQLVVALLSNEMDMLEEAKVAFDAGNLTASEFEEISNDIIESIAVDELAKKVDNKRVAKEVVDKLRQITTAAISLAGK